MGALEPLTEARVAYFESARRELVGLNYAETIRSPLELTGGTWDPSNGPAVQEASQAALTHAAYFAELLNEWAQDADADERLYRLGASMLDALASGAPAEPLARYFEYWLLRLQGVYPESKESLSSGAKAFLVAARTVAPHDIGSVTVDSKAVRELERVHPALITMHLEKT